MLKKANKELSGLPARMVGCCQTCYFKSEIDGAMPDIRKEGKWKGNEPEFYHLYA